MAFYDVRKQISPEYIFAYLHNFQYNLIYYHKGWGHFISDVEFLFLFWPKNIIPEFSNSNLKIIFKTC